MIRTKDKKAIARKTLIEMLIIIISAVIIILLFGNISYLFGTEIDKDICSGSVLTRAAIIEKTGIFEKLTSLPPLKCKTQYYCLSMDGKGCPEKYAKVKVKDEEAIKKEIANYMYDCWSMLGEGKRNFLKEGARSLICSVIKFDDKIKSKHPSINGIYNYMNEKNIPGGNVTFLQYIAGVNNLQGKVKVESDKIITDRDYAIIFTRYKGSGILKTSTVLGSAALLGEGLLMVLIPASIPVVAPIFIGTAGAATTGVAIEEIIEQIEASRVCEDGICSVLTIMPYDINLAKVAGTLESVP